MTSIEKYAEKSHDLIVKYLNDEISERDFLIMHHNLYYEIKPLHRQEVIDAINSVELVNRYYYRNGKGYADDIAGKEIALTGREYIGLSITGEKYYHQKFDENKHKNI